MLLKECVGSGMMLEFRALLYLSTGSQKAKNSNRMSGNITVATVQSETDPPPKRHLCFQQLKPTALLNLHNYVLYYRF